MKTVDKFDRLINWFLPTDRLFKEFKLYTLDYNNKEKRRIFIDNNGKILFVAHIDTTQRPHFHRQKKSRIYATGLDDRLGCWLAYTLSKQLKADLLLCDNEESGKSTALYHNCKDYNWIAEFDRGNSDVVTYDLDSTEFKKALQKFFEIGLGAFSDISFLETSACCVNVGIGYHHAHSKDSYVDLPITQKQIGKFIEFYYQYKDTLFERDLYCEPFFNGRGRSAKYYEVLHYPDFAEVYYNRCEFCDGIGQQVYDHVICSECFDEILNSYFDLCYGETF